MKTAKSRAPSGAFHTQSVILLAVVLLLIDFGDGRPMGKNAVSAAAPDPVDYLLKYGYINPVTLRSANVSSAPLLGPDSPEVADALRDFQDFAGIPVTGRLDAATRGAMAAPRCGVRDRNPVRVRFRRYVEHGSRWEKRHLTYHVGSYPKGPSDLSRPEVDAVIAQAFGLWASPRSPLTFSPAAGPRQADIRLDFFSFRHGERGEEPFDGTGGVLAHAFFPRFGGDVHFDDSEEWMVRRDRARERRGAKQLLQTAAHEIGHSLGLQHSKDRDALMAPFYREWMEPVELRYDDVEGIAAIYGRGGNKPVPTTTTSKPKVVRPNNNGGNRRPFGNKPGFKPITPAPTRRPNGNNKPGFKPVTPGSLCSDPGIDAAVQTADGSFYVFRGDQYWKLNAKSSGLAPGYPRHVSDWSGIPGKVDAAFYNPADGATYIFRGERVAKFRNLQIEAGYPRRIVDEFRGAPARDLDAALVWGKNGQLYLFKGDRYWKYNFAKGAVEHSYPRATARNWQGVPSPVAAALRWSNGKSYFFTRSGEYYRFDDGALSVDRASPVPFPRTAGKWWFGCGRGNSREEATDNNNNNSNNNSKGKGGSGNRQPKRWEWSG